MKTAPSILLYKNAAGTITLSVGMSDTDSTVSFGFELTQNDAHKLMGALSLVTDDVTQTATADLTRQSKAFMECGCPKPELTPEQSRIARGFCANPLK